jgi:pSer/pThr/pTyr-binding forkhead associated (FHA) protein
MITCPSCRHQMPEGSVFCEECGMKLLEITATMKFDLRTNEFDAKLGVGTETLADDQTIVVQIGDTSQAIDILPGVEFVLGRAASSGVQPDLDLTDHGGVDMGVSRRHAALRRGEGVLSLVDFESTNGTFLNGHRLAANRPQIVRSGDEIRLGKLAIHIYFGTD